MTYLAQKKAPTNAIFEIEIGGLSRIYEYGPGEATVPMSFNLKETSAMGVGTFTAVLFDDTGFDVEPHFWLARDESKGNAPMGRCRWGYTAQNGSDLSEWRSFMLQGYNTAIGHNYFTLTANGYLTSATTLIASNQYNGTLQECLEAVAKIHNYTLEVTPNIDLSKLKVMDPTGRTSEYRTATFSKTNEETDLSFVQRLVNYAVSPDGKVGYTLSFVTEGGIDKMKLTLPENAPKTRRYVVQDKDSVVVSWNPNISFTGVSALGASQVMVNGYNPRTGEDQKFCLDFRNTKPYGSELGPAPVNTNLHPYPPIQKPQQLKYYCSENMEESVTSRGLRVRRGPSFDPIVGFTRTLSNHLAQALWGNTATLTVLGDPYLVPNTQIEVVYFYPHSLRYPNTAGKRHFTSGLYYCTEVEHEITNGKYTTTATLIRFGPPQEPGL